MPDSQKSISSFFPVSLFFFVVGWVFTILPISGYGQSPYTPQSPEPITEQWRWRQMENLSGKGVRSMTNDNEGNMWFGLDKGIIKYDGIQYEYFDQLEFLNHPVGIMFLSDDKELFAGSESGLLKFNGTDWEKIFPGNDSVNINVTCIRSLPDGTIAVGIHNGVLLIKNNEFSLLTVNALIPSFQDFLPDMKTIVLPDELLFQRSFGRVDELFMDEEGLFWLFMSRNNDGKLLQFNPNDIENGVLRRYEIHTHLGNHPLANRIQMLKTPENGIWLINGFYKSGILRYINNSWSLLKLSDVFGGDELHTSIIEMSDGSIWIGGLGKLFVYKNDNWHLFIPPSPPIPSSRIILHETSDQDVWIAGIQGDVFRLSYNTDRWLVYKGLNFQFSDNQGKEWFIGVNDQVVVNDQGRWYAYDTTNGLIQKPIRLILTRNGRVWAAGSHQGVSATAYLDQDRWTIQLHPKLSWGIDPRSVFQDRAGNLWFGASVDRQDAQGQVSGVLRLANPDSDHLEWKHFTQNEGIVQHNVYGIGESPDGDIWLGGTNLLRFNGNRWQSLPGKEYFSEFIDIVHSGENLWVGSRYYGLFRFDGQEWTQFTVNQGLPSNTIISIFEENPESVWVITDKDIVRFDGKDWHRNSFSGEFHIQREGGEIRVANDGSVWINQSLREWKRRAFPFSITPEEAFHEFFSIRYVRKSEPPKTEIHLYSERVDHLGNTLIAWRGADIWEETPWRKLTYSYRLNDEEWSPFSNETSVMLTKLKDGKHVFEVRARDMDFNIEKSSARIYFTVRPPIWKQSWFIALLVSFLMLIGFYETRLIKRNRSLFRLNVSLQDVNQRLGEQKNKIETQKEKILYQKEELENKALILEAKNAEIIQQRDQLSEMVEKVETLSNVKTRFFTNISHEFRTPLTLILGSIEQLLATPDIDRSRINKTYEVIHRSSKRILKLINQILEIRKIETGKMMLRATPGDIVLFTGDITSMFRELAGSHHIQLTFKSQYQTLPANFDHDIIEKILFNLLSNAFKSTPPGGSVSVMLNVTGSTTKPSHEKTLPQNALFKNGSDENRHFIEMIVRDNGHGIPEEHIDKIFDRFYQVDDIKQFRKFDSTGIGLSYVKDLINIHDGDIKVESKPMEYTVFTVRFPCVKCTVETEMQQNEPAMSMVSEAFRKEIQNVGLSDQPSQVADVPFDEIAARHVADDERLMVLVVEDEDELRHFIKNLLMDEFEVIEAVDGSEGYRLAVELQPDIIITDVMMPLMNGHELCDKLKKDLVTNHIPVIMLTAQALPEHKLLGYQTGADAYIEKPFNTDYLKIRIHNLLNARLIIREKTLRDLITQPKEIDIQSESDRMLHKIQQVLEENISNAEFDVESMSQQFFLSRFHFSRKIKQITGLTPKEIIDSYRLKRAGQLLQQNLAVSEVAYMVGFDHPNSFTRAFRKYFNMTPTEYASSN